MVVSYYLLDVVIGSAVQDVFQNAEEKSGMAWGGRVSRVLVFELAVVSVEERGERWSLLLGNVEGDPSGQLGQLP